MKSKCGAALLLMLVLGMACAGALAAEYTVTFNENNIIPGSSGTTFTVTNMPSQMTVTEGGKVNEPTAPTADGYVFGGWYTDENCTSAYDFETQVQQNFTLYAKWMLAVTFHDNAPRVTDPGTGNSTPITVAGMPNPATVPIGATVVQPKNPTAVGYTFKGWYTEAACTNAYNFNTPVTRGFTLYAKWEQKTYTVTFDLQDSSLTAIPSVTGVIHGATVAAPDPAPEKTGYTFGGWYKEPTCANKFIFSGDTGTPDKVTSNITLYAKWSINQYEVTFDNKGHGIQPPKQMVNHGEKARDPGDLVEQGYRFEGWFTNLSEPNTEYHFTEKVTSNVTLYAKWTKQHTVKFNMNGHGAVIKPMTVDDGSTLSAPTAPSAEGYTFGGWYTDVGCSTGNAVTFPATITSDTTYYAKWTANVKVTFQWRQAVNGSEGPQTGQAEIQLMIDGKEATTADVDEPSKTLAPGTETELWSLSPNHTYTVSAKNVRDNYTAVCTRTAENTFLVTYVENEKLLNVNIINRHEADTIDMVISKYWDDNNNQHRPGSIQVQVMKVVNGVKEPVKDKNGADIVLTLNDSNQWTGHVTDLYMREKGTTIQYIIEEVGEVKGYKATCEIVVDAQGNYTVRVTNVLTGKVDISGEKVWEDDNDRDGIRPQSVQLKIYENSISDATLVKNIIVDKNGNGSTANNWTWTVEDLPVYDKFGGPITYIVVEDPVPAGYTASDPVYITVGTTP